MDYGIFNVRTDVNACDCARERTDTVKESALKVDPGRKIPCRTKESNLRRRRAGPMLYQLSYIPSLEEEEEEEEEEAREEKSDQQSHLKANNKHPTWTRYAPVVLERLMQCVGTATKPATKTPMGTVSVEIT